MDAIGDNDDNYPRRPVGDWDYKRKRFNASPSRKIEANPTYTDHYENSDAKESKNGPLTPDDVEKILQWPGMLETAAKDSQSPRRKKLKGSSEEISQEHDNEMLLLTETSDVKEASDNGLSSDFTNMTKPSITLEKAEDILILCIDEDTSWLSGPIPSFNKGLEKKTEE